MNQFPKEFFLGDNFSIGKTRLQKFNDCWALAGVSAIEDIFSIDNNLEAVYLSPAYIASMANDACRFLNHQNCNFTFQTGYNFNNIAYYMDNNKYGAKLDSCYPYDETPKYLLDKGYKKFPDINKNDWNTGNYYVLESVKKLCPNGCIQEKTRGKIKKYICQKEDTLRQNFQLKIEAPINTDMYQNLTTKESYDVPAIKNNQSIMKHIIYLRKKPIIASIMVTTEYIKFFENKNNEYFSPQEKLDSEKIFQHAVVIVGWSLKDKLEYWIIRDTNFPNKFLKVAFSGYSNKDYWVGLDIKWDDMKNSNISYSVKGDYGQNTLNNYLNEGVFKQTNIIHNEL